MAFLIYVNKRLIDGTQRAVACPSCEKGPEMLELVNATGVVHQASNMRWYAIRVRSQHEDIVARHLRVRGMESFLPLYKQRHKWSDRFKVIELPLFPGYVFCQFNPANRLPVLTVPGVVHVVGIGQNPTPVDDNEIMALRVAVNSGFPTQPWPFLEVGQWVRVEQGPLSGAEGILLSVRREQRIVLSITLLQRSVAVEIDRECVRPLQKQSDSSRLSHEHRRHQPLIA